MIMMIQRWIPTTTRRVATISIGHVKALTFKPNRALSSSSSSSSSSLVDSDSITNLEQVLESIAAQQLQDDLSRPPQPWFTLLHHPSRASWRSTDRLFDSSPLSQTQFNMIQRSGRTHRQLRRTYERIIGIQTTLAKERERERRTTANAARSESVLEEMEQLGRKRILAGEKAVGYGPEQTLANAHHRFGPNYSIAKRVLLEVQSLLGSFRPVKVLDFGCGVGSSSAAALDVFGAARGHEGIEWVHCVDASRSMRDATEGVLTSVLEGVPWGGVEEPDLEPDEDLEYCERVLKEIKGGEDERKLERRRMRMLKWERQWEKRDDYRTRLTFGESIVDSSTVHSQETVNDGLEPQRSVLPWQKKLDEQRQKSQQKKQELTNRSGSFDLILCNYTICELSGVPSTLSASALLWEKLAPGGVMVFIEPGTPDGFNSLRSVRSMLLECCPPAEIRRVQKHEAEGVLMERYSDDVIALRAALEELDAETWREECQVIAPCTHNGRCPMLRHETNHVKRSRSGSPEGEDSSKKEKKDPYPMVMDGDMNPIRSDADEEETLMQELVDQGMDRAELEEMMRIMESMQDEEDDVDDSGSDEDSDQDCDDSDNDDFLEINGEGGSITQSQSSNEETHVFDRSFCSFVHNFPGGTYRKKGEKFSYLVVQKHTNPGTNIFENDESDDRDSSINNGDIVEMLTKSLHHVTSLKAELLKEEKLNRITDENTKLSTSDPFEESRHVIELRNIFSRAVQLEKDFLESASNPLGLELIHSRKQWGRLVRAPLKKKGHVLLDYCSGAGTRGRITRQRVSRGWSMKVAPGSYGAARKARWGGLWPDISGGR